MSRARAWIHAPAAPRSRAWLQLFRVASVLVPAALAWRVTAEAGDHAPLVRAFPYALGPLWLVLFASFARRVVDAAVRHRRDPSPEVSFLDRIDILTASGSALSWTASGAVALSASNGWASLSVVGLLGLAVFHLVAIWSLWRTGGDDPWRKGSLTRRFATERPVEGGPLIEELTFEAPRIPAGFRLFARGRVGPRWATSRYVVEGCDDGAEVRLATDVGPAVRGQHRAEPLEVWLQDVLGLCHTMKVRVAPAQVLVYPRARAIRGVSEIVRARDGVEMPQPVVRAPTEGVLHLREYQPSDDARRIHWPRSIGTGRTLVRTPDEVPCDDRAVRLVLDTHLANAKTFSCPAPGELLDALVALWLGVARSLLAAGARVDLVVATDGRVEVVPLRRVAGLASRADEVGARVSWQEDVPLERLLTSRPSFVVSYRHQRLPASAGATSWILAREWAWVSFDRKPQATSAVCLPHPMGSPENGGARRRRERDDHWQARLDHGRFTRSCGDADRADAVTFLATPSLGGAIHVEKLQ